MTSNEFLEEMKKLEKNYKVTLDKETLKIWWNEFNSLSKDNFSKAINKTLQTSNYMPKISEVKKNILTNRMNLDSSYWYTNLKDIRPCFNVKTGELLEPYN